MRVLPLPASVLPAVTIATLVLGGWLAWGSARHPDVLWAPGDLSRYHHDVRECRACHEPFQGASPARCVSCHTPARFAASSGEEVRLMHETRRRLGQSCLDCHWEHRGALAQITIGSEANPHGEFVFTVTGTRSCTECHAFSPEAGRPPRLLTGSRPVRELLAEGEGAHRPGRFARCLQCHGGGELDVEEEDAGRRGDGIPRPPPARGAVARPAVQTAGGSQ